MPVSPHFRGGPDVPLVDGGTGASNAATARSNIGAGDLTAGAHAILDHTGVDGVGLLVGWSLVETASVVVCNALLTQDDSIPQTSEGTLVLQTASYTPKSLSNFLEITFTGAGGMNGNLAVTAFFTRDATPAAFFASPIIHLSSTYAEFSLRTIIQVTDLSPRFYRAYIGNNFGGGFNFTVNGIAGARRLGGVSRAVLSIKELAP